MIQDYKGYELRLVIDSCIVVKCVNEGKQRMSEDKEKNCKPSPLLAVMLEVINFYSVVN